MVKLSANQPSEYFAAWPNEIVSYVPKSCPGYWPTLRMSALNGVR